MSTNPDRVRAAIEVLAELDHHDRSRHAARLLAAEPVEAAQLQRAADGAVMLAHDLAVERRVAESARDREHPPKTPSTYR